MSRSMVETREKTFTAGGALAQYRRVRLDAGKLAYAGAADTDGVGVMSRPSFADGDVVSVILRTAQGTVTMVAAGAITAGATCYAAASGKVASSGTVIAGVAIDAAGADGDLIEVLPAVNTAFGTVDRASITQQDDREYPINLVDLRVWDALHTNLPGTAAADDLALVGGTFGTGAPTVRGVDFGGTTTTAHARFLFQLPVEYVAGQSVTLRLRGGMLTTVSDGTATVDAAVHKLDKDGGVSADLCATAAQSINSLTIANKDFTVTPTSLAPGDVLDIRVTVAGSDTGNAAVMIPVLTNAALLLDVKG